MAALKLLAYLFLGYFILLALLYLFQRHLIYFPSSYVGTPETAGVPEMKEITLYPNDGITLKAWYRPPLQNHLPTVVHFHGNAGHIGNRAMLMRSFLNAGFGVLLLTYRGYSGNPGYPFEEGLYLDARSALKYLQDSGVQERCIVLYGDSIGASVAVQMATEYPVGAIILQAPFTSLMDVGRFHYPFIPVQWFLKDKYNALAKAKKVQVPVFILHGKNDDIIPPTFGRKLYEAFSAPKQIEFIPQTGHNDLFEPDRIIRFIKEWVKCKVD